VVAYIRGYVEAVRWLYDPTNTSQGCDILERNISLQTPKLTAAIYGRLLEPGGGFFRDGRVDDAGVRRVLRLRSRYAAGHRVLSDPGRYSDASYWEQASQSDAARR